ncbi:MAG: DUF2191 domain-containing protein [Thermoleophilia bacterium]|nr:DUF2191 domain-containing protein [Thermoleophilia bacterium]
MVSHIKTTIEITDSLLAAARELATRRGVTLRALVEAGLRRELEASEPREAFRLRDASVDGRGLQPEFREAGWERIRDAAYEGRGS